MRIEHNCTGYRRWMLLTGCVVLLSVMSIAPAIAEQTPSFIRTSSEQIWMQNNITVKNLSDNLPAFILAISPLGLLLLSFVRETRQFGLDKSDPFVFKAGFSRHKINSTTGVVLDPNKNPVTETHVSGGQAYMIGNQIMSSPVRSTTTTTIHDRFFIFDPERNVEMPFKTWNLDIAMREGHIMSAVGCLKKGEANTDYFLFRNHSVQRDYPIDSTLSKIIKPQIWPILPLLYASFTFIGIYVLTYGMPESLMKISDNFTMWLSCYVALIVLIFFAFRQIVKLIRLRSVKNQLIERLYPVLEERASMAKARMLADEYVKEGA